jgi:hypothetical protein
VSFLYLSIVSHPDARLFTGLRRFSFARAYIIGSACALLGIDRHAYYHEQLDSLDRFLFDKK